MSLALAIRLFVLTTRRLCCGSNAYPLHVMPPRFPGTAREPCRLGGVKIPSLRSPRIQLRQVSRSCGVDPHASSADTLCKDSGGGATGKGCVGDATSPGMSLF